MIRITCGACQKPVSVDEARLPFQPVTFPCPGCKAPITIDRRTLAPAAPSAPPAAPEPLAAPAPDLPEEDEDHISAKALIVGADSPALRQAARDIGLQPVFFPTVEAGRDYYQEKFPTVVFLSPAQLTRPPLAEMQLLTSLPAADRRRGFFILVADGLKTLDGTVAFLYDVNLVIATRDLPSIRRIYHDADEEHQRFYSAFRTAEKVVREGV
ncbi:MAG TPA: hypothetical protein VEW48_06690 [Thermoanaerobaculia bacterium]|nr:hypothetical protein [Thermoanaerobaculia bacterium]